MEIFFLALFALVVAGLAIWGWMATKRRREALSGWAQSRALSFSAANDHGMENRLPNFQCLHQGSNRYAYNVMEGMWGQRQILAFDYHYETHSTGPKGQTQTHHYYFSAVVLSSAVPLKPLFLRPENFFDKIGEFFGFDDIDFESAEFSRKFYAKSPDKKWAYDVIHPRTMEFLLTSPQFAIQFDLNDVMAYRSSEFSVSDFEQAAEVAGGILDRLPEYLIKQQTAKA